MSKNYTVTLLFAFAAIALTAFFLLRGSGGDESDDDETVDVETDQPRPTIKLPAGSEKEPRPPIEEEVDENALRDLALEELKGRYEEYLELKRNGEDKKKLRRLAYDLAKEAAARLQASEQAIQLLMFLEELGMGSEARTVRLRIDDVIETADPESLVEALVDLISNRFDDLEDGYSGDVLGWSYLLGERGSESVYEQFLGAVDEKWPRGDFQYAWHKTNAKSDPVGSYTSVVDLIKAGSKGSRQDQAIQRIVENFPKGEQIDYKALESMLPVEGDDAYRKARSTIMMRWAENEPTEAVNHAIEHPERVPLRDVTYIVAQAIKDLGDDGIEWVKDFPEGPYYDRAAVAVVHRYWHSDRPRATEWANSIGDEALRKEQIQNIETLRRRDQRREK